MSWELLLSVILPLVGKYFGPLVEKLIGHLLPKTGAVPQSVSAAPTNLKEFLKDILTKQVESRLAFAPVLQKIVLAFVAQLDVVIDLVWDKLFEQNLVTAKPTKFGAAPETLLTPIDVPPEAAGVMGMEFGG